MAARCKYKDSNENQCILWAHHTGLHECDAVEKFKESKNMTYFQGQTVFFVPSHDGEYDARPGIGTIVGGPDGDRYLVRQTDENSGRGYRDYSVPERFLAHVDMAFDVLRLIKYLNQRELDLKSLLYMVELAILNKQGDEEAMRWIKKQDRYHIN